MRIFTVIFFSVLFSFQAWSQEEEFEMKHKLALSSGITFVPKTFNDQGDKKFSFVPTIGLDYNFDFHKYMGIGMINEFELSQYYIEKDSLGEIEREFAYTGLLTFNVFPVKNWGIFVGGGIEVDKHKLLPCISVGTEYEFSFGKSWFGKFLFQYNYLFKYQSFSFGIGIGHEFLCKKKSE